MKIFLVVYALPGLILALAIPMALGLVPPNETYGFRTPWTLSSPEIWYRANRVCGWLMIIAMLVTIGINVALSSRHPEWTVSKFVLVAGGTLTVSLLVAVAASYVLVRH